uniref:Uncharacterized protein n=1 Tax=Parascaris univalens TaxID=6257 RepID=A0A915B578_PARUN
YVVTQIVCAYVFTFFIQGITIAWIGLYNPDAGAVTCAKTNYMPGELYTLLVFIRVSAASLSILFMFITLVKLRVRVETSSQYRTDAQLRAFMRRQRSFTN